MKDCDLSIPKIRFDGVIEFWCQFVYRYRDMVSIIRLLVTTFVCLFRSRTKLQHEILILRHQLNVLRRVAPRRVSLTNLDRLLCVWSFRAWPAKGFQARQGPYS